ncbi:APC family permease [Candidatus Bathyarchaeota archaeon]|nr:APC family permease [Candidatus Bathyarchaeota archaeon]
MEKPRVFVRTASGLIRTVSTLDAFFLSFWALSPLLGGVFIFWFSAAVFPGGHLPLASLVSIPFSLALAAVYAYFCSAMPRSGGDYIFVSRVLHPVLGFFMNFNYIFWVGLAWYPLNAWLTLTFSFSLAKSMGFSGVYDFWTQPTPFFIAGIIYIILMGIMMVLGMKVYTKIQLIAGILGFIATALALGVFAAHLGVDGFKTVFNSWAAEYTGMSDSYGYIIGTAEGLGEGFKGWTGTGFLGSLAVLWFLMTIPVWSNWVAGEIKRADAVKTHMTAMGGTAILAGIICAIFTALIMGVTGWRFYTAFGYLTLYPPEGWAIPITAEWPNIMRIIETNPALLTLIDLGFAAAAFILIPMDILLFTRCAFAWSFDRIAPQFLSDVNPRFHTPVKTIALFTLIGIFWWWFYLYSGMYALIAAVTIGVSITFIVTSIAGIAFPYLRRDLYEASPAKKEILGIPAITIAGIIATVYMCIMIGMYLVHPGLRELSISPSVAVLIIAIFIVSVLIFYAARVYHKRKEGIDIMWAFKELPPG